MKRREFITVLGGAAAWPLAARAQETGKLPRIGFLGGSTPAAQLPWTTAFVQRLRELGWTEGRNVVIEYRWAEGLSERYTEIAAEFVRLKVDVIFTHGTPATILAKQTTSVIPIVFTVVGDPVGTGIIASLARPGGNVTGQSSATSDLAAKRLELLRDVVPRVSRLGIFGNIDNSTVVLEIAELQAAARTLGLEVATFGIRRAEDVVPVFEMLKNRADALYVAGDPIVLTNGVRINILAVGARLLAATRAHPREQFVRGEAERNAGVEMQSRRFAREVPTKRMEHVRDAGLNRIEGFQGPYHRAGGKHFDPDATAGSLL